MGTQNNYVMPMYATISMNFTFVGPYGGAIGGGNGNPVLSTDQGGVFTQMDAQILF